MGVKYSNFIEHGLHLASKLLFLQYSIKLKPINSMSCTENHLKVNFFNCQAFISMKSNTYVVNMDLNLNKPTPVRILALRNNKDYQALDSKGNGPKRFK